ncbi:MAG: selenocysteine synthase, partial [Acidobacteriota bacterium]
AEGREFQRRAEVIRAAATSVPGVAAEIFVPEVANHVPHLRVTWDAAARGLDPAAVVHALQAGEPSIVTRSENGALVIGVWMMDRGDDRIVARRLREELAGTTKRA